MSKTEVKVFSIIAVLVNIVLFVIGICLNKDFWKITLSSLLTIDLTAFLSVLLVQNLASQRRGYDFIVRELDTIIEDIAKESLLNHNDNVQASVLQRVVANKLLYIYYACPNRVKHEMEYIKEKYEEMQNFYGDHADAKPNDPFYERTKADIIVKVVKVQLSLFGFEVSNRKEKGEK